MLLVIDDGLLMTKIMVSKIPLFRRPKEGDQEEVFYIRQLVTPIVVPMAVNIAISV